MIKPGSDVELIYKPTLEHALKCFENDIKESGVFTLGALENIMSARREEADRLIASMQKKTNRFFPSFITKQTNNFFLALDAGANMCLELKKYDQVKLELVESIPDDKLKDSFINAYQQTLNEHVSLAKLLLTEKDSIAQVNEMNVTAKRVANLTRYVNDPNNPGKLSAVAKDTEYVDKMANTRRNKIILGGLIRLVGYGVMVLSLSLGFAAAASLFFIGPVGIAGFAFSMGLNIAGNMLRKLGKKMMERPITKDKIIDMGNSLKLFSHPEASKTDSNSKSSKDTDIIISVNSKNRSSKN